MSRADWGDYDKREVSLSADRTGVIGELEVSSDGIDKVNSALGFDVEEAFDEFRETDFEDIDEELESDAAVSSEGEDVILEGNRDIKTPILAHEAVHGKMMQPDGETDLPSEDLYEERVYEEFVAIVAEDEVRDVSIENHELAEFHDRKTDYFEIREEMEGEYLSEEFDSLYDDFKQIGKIENRDVQRMADEALSRYQDLRETVLAKQAALEYKQKNEWSLQNLMEPDKRLYEETVGYIKSIEDNILRKIR